MRPIPRLAVGYAALLCAALELVAARAAAQTEPVRVSYSAPPSCPADSAFIERVRSRLQRGTFAETGELARAFDVTVTSNADNQGFLGHIEFVAVDGQRAVRNVAGATCDELVSSLALITALAIDDRSAESESTSAEPAPLPSPPPAGPSAPPKKIELSTAASPREPESTEARVRRPLRWDVGANAGIMSWVTRSVAFDVGAFAELGSRDPSWSARLSAFYSSDTKDGATSSANFKTGWLRLEACPVALALPARFSLAPCAAFDAGLLQSKGEPSATLVNTKTDTNFWAAGVLLARLAWLVRERLVLGLDGELAVPLVRREFRVRNPDSISTATLLQVPQIGFGVKIGVGLRFP